MINPNKEGIKIQEKSSLITPCNSKLRKTAVVKTKLKIPPIFSQRQARARPRVLIAIKIGGNCSITVVSPTA
jgi:hypothetical protein